MEGIWGLLEDWTVRCDISLTCKSNTLCNIVTHALELFKKAEMEGGGTKKNNKHTHKKNH